MNAIESSSYTAASKLFSIITPTYHSGQELEVTIESVLAQDEALFEYLIQDGGSSEETTAILTRYAERISWVAQSDSGVYDAMNKAISRSSGHFIYFLGAGDTLKPGVLQTLAQQLPPNPNAFVYGDIWERLVGRKFNGRYNVWKLSRVNICHQAVVCGRGVFDIIGLFDIRYPILADYVFNLRCFGNPHIQKIYIDETIADFAGGGLSATHRDAQFLEDRLKLFAENLGWGPFALNKAISLIPAQWKETRYRLFRKIKACFLRHN